MRQSLLFILTFFLLTIFVNCKTVRYVPVEQVHRDTTYIRQVERDSVHERDSIYIYRDADTVYSTRTRTIYRDRVRRDTLYFARCDTVAKVVEVERELSKIQRIKLALGEVMLLVIVVAAGVAVVWFVRKFKGF